MFLSIIYTILNKYLSLIKEILDFGKKYLQNDVYKIQNTKYFICNKKIKEII